MFEPRTATSDWSTRSRQSNGRKTRNGPRSVWDDAYMGGLIVSRSVNHAFLGQRSLARRYPGHSERRARTTYSQVVANSRSNGGELNGILWSVASVTSQIQCIGGFDEKVHACVVGPFHYSGPASLLCPRGPVGHFGCADAKKHAGEYCRRCPTRRVGTPSERESPLAAFGCPFAIFRPAKPWPAASKPWSLLLGPIETLNLSPSRGSTRSC